MYIYSRKVLTAIIGNLIGFIGGYYLYKYVSTKQRHDRYATLLDQLLSINRINTHIRIKFDRITLFTKYSLYTY